MSNFRKGRRIGRSECAGVPAAKASSRVVWPGLIREEKKWCNLSVCEVDGGALVGPEVSLQLPPALS